MKPLLLNLVCLFSSCICYSQTTLIPFGSVWKYLDNGSDQGTAWRSETFADAGWPQGNGLLGYGHGDETTVVGYGGNSSNKFITTY
ncbi:MAG TPA: hypothetical protein VFL47_05700, partial [Flavisolibacter sp.]|nr:hypothetical protein [Flavisolibacter sp.]